MWHASWNAVFHAGTWCPTCSASRLERETALALDDLGIPFVREKRFGDCRSVGGRPLPFDFHIPHLNACIECDGRQHYEAIRSFGGAAALARLQANDAVKTAWCGRTGIHLLRIPYFELRQVGRIVTKFVRPLAGGSRDRRVIGIVRAAGRSDRASDRNDYSGLPLFAFNYRSRR